MPRIEKKIKRGKRVITHVSPDRPEQGFELDQLDGLLARGRQLSALEAKTMVSDVRAVRAQLKAKGRSDPWA
jgi:hypothetical protein